VVNRQRVLVAFSSRSGSTAGTAEEIAAFLRAQRFVVDCRSQDEVVDLTIYRAVILGSGMFVASRASDGGGFIERHAAALRGLDLWLFCSGPIGGHRVAPGEESPVAAVARAVGARGVATFGAVETDGQSPLAAPVPADRLQIRAWAAEIAAGLGIAPAPARRGRNRCHGAVPAR
jgi:menaquinone-dependent protoporphyrinogen oxidase